jgi:hypothetical protein
MAWSGPWACGVSGGHFPYGECAVVGWSPASRLSPFAHSRITTVPLLEPRSQHGPRQDSCQLNIKHMTLPRRWDGGQRPRATVLLPPSAGSASSPSASHATPPKVPPAARRSAAPATRSSATVRGALPQRHEIVLRPDTPDDDITPTVVAARYEKSPDWAIQHCARICLTA